MKRMLWIMLLCSITLTARADGDRPIQPNQLPERAQTFLATHFADRAVSLAKADRDLLELHYEVVLMGGEKIEFARSGEWEEISCHYTAVPKGVVPDAIRTHFEGMYPESQLLEIKRERGIYELKLNNGRELTYNRNLQLVDMDIDD